MRIKAALIPAERWRAPDFAVLVDQIQNAARRISKGVNVSRERKRFSSGCDVLERAALQDSGVAKVALSDADATVVLSLLSRLGPARLPFLSPREVVQMRSRLPRALRTEFPSEFALVIIVDAFGSEPVAPGAPGPDTDPPQQPSRALDVPHCVASLAESQTRPEGYSRARRQIWRALEASERLRIGTRHEYLIPALREFVYLNEVPMRIRQVPVRRSVPDEETIRARRQTWLYRILETFLPFLLPTSVPMREVTVMEKRKEPAPAEPFHLQVVYQDGSLGEPFPLLALAPAPRPKNAAIMRVGLMSVRHFDLDPVVDLYLLRNAEIPRGEAATAAEQEQAAFAKANGILTELVSLSPATRVELFHTGLPPALLGAYRAVLNLLMNPKIRGRLEVIPMLYKGDRYEPMEPWY